MNDNLCVVLTRRSLNISANQNSYHDQYLTFRPTNSNQIFVEEQPENIYVAHGVTISNENIYVVKISSAYTQKMIKVLLSTLLLVKEEENAYIINLF